MHFLICFWICLYIDIYVRMYIFCLFYLVLFLFLQNLGMYLTFGSSFSFITFIILGQNLTIQCKLQWFRFEWFMWIFVDSCLSVHLSSFRTVQGFNCNRTFLISRICGGWILRCISNVFWVWEFLRSHVRAAFVSASHKPYLCVRSSNSVITSQA